MSSREKRYLIFFAAAGFILLNVFGFRLLTDQRDTVRRDRESAARQLDQARMISTKREEVAGEMDWLDEHQPEPAAEQDVQSALQGLVEREARSRGLTLKPGKYLPTDKTGVHYHRVKYEIPVSGSEQSLYSWLDRLQVPTEFRAVTFLRVSPNREDDTKADATVIVEQWYVPNA
jgi:uncharacterized iron-regulated membrane protein